MNSRYVITHHAYKRLFERTYLEPIVREQLERSVAFGAQYGDKELRLLPCGLVAAVSVSTDGNRPVVTTFLTKEMATANMQANWLNVEESPEHNGHRPSLPELAAQHAENNVGAKRRNQALRDLGYDPAGEDGVLYRKHLTAARGRR